MAYPVRGAVYWVHLDHTVDSQIKKGSLAVVVSNNISNQYASRILVVPITSSAQKLFPFEVPIACERIKGKALADSQWPQTGDKVYALYTPAGVARQMEHKQHITSSVRMVAAVGMLLGVLAIGYSTKGTTGPPGADVQIAQEGAGGTPYIRVNTDRGFIPETSQKIFDLLGLTESVDKTLWDQAPNFEILNGKSISLFTNSSCASRPLIPGILTSMTIQPDSLS